MEYQDFLELASQRRSIRKFIENRAIPREDLKKIVHAGMQAPSAANLQSWEMVVIDAPELIVELSDSIIESLGDKPTARGFTKASAFILLYGDQRTRQYVPKAFQGNDSWWNFSLSTTLSNAFMTMQYAATSLGLGSQWVSAFRNPVVGEKAKSLLHIPDELTVFEMLAIGYPDTTAPKKKLRNIEDTIHFNVAENYRTEEELESYYRPHAKKD